MTPELDRTSALSPQATGASSSGATPLERVAARLHIPFVLLAGLIAFVLSAFAPQTTIPGAGEAGGVVGGLVNARIDVVMLKVILFAAMFYVLLIRRRIVRQVVRVGTQLPHRTENPEGYFRGVADRTSRFLIPIVLAVIAVIAIDVTIVLLAPNSFLYDWDQLPFYTIFSFVRIYILTLGVYTFAAIAWGIYRYGQKPLNAVSFWDDPALGLSPLGALTISLVIDYVILMAFLALFGLVSSNSILVFGVVGVMAIAGLALFVLPLRTFHEKMKAEKHRALEQVGNRFKIELRKVDLSGEAEDVASPTTILALEAIEKRVNAIRTWPFPTGAAESLAGQLVIPIVLSITAGVALNFLTH